MLNLGFCFAMVPFAKKMLKGNNSKSDFYKRNLDFFNTHPYMAGWLIGAALNFEEKVATNQTDINFARQKRFTKMMSESLAAVGDQLFWARLKPISALIGFIIALFFNITGSVLFFLLYNLPHLYMRIRSVSLGYREGENIVQRFSFKSYYKLIDKLLKFAAFLTGCSLILITIFPAGTGIPYAIAVIFSAVSMFFFLVKNVSAPIGMIMLIILSIMIGFLFG